jgi:hypothetical protein
MLNTMHKRFDKVLQRVLEIIPGLLTWSVLTAPLWLGSKFPLGVIFFITFLSFFWVYRAIVHTIGAFIGYKRYKKELASDWLTLAKKLNFNDLPNKNDLPENISRIRHLVLIPMVNEGVEVLRNTFLGLSLTDFPKDQIVVVATCEERGAVEVKERIELLKKEIKNLPEILFYVHPKGIEGEAVGAGAANRSWGGRHAVEELKRRKANLNNYIFTTFDADARVHPKYFSRVTYAFLTDEKRRERFYQTAAYLSDNNIWDVPSLMRIQASSVTMAILSAWVVEPERMQTFSAYTTALTTLVEADFWDVTLGVDDTTFFWRAYLAKDGNFSGMGVFIPISSDAVQGSSWWNSHKSQYKQLVRWGWGVLVFPIAIRGFLTNSKIPLKKRFFQTYYLIETYTVWITIVFLISFGIFILYTVNPEAKQDPLAYSIPKVTSTVLTFAIFLLIPASLIKEKMMAKKPNDWPWWKKVATYLEGPMVIVNLLTYGFLPYIHAETKFMLGKKMKDLYFTPKVRTKTN